ncbi:MAG TPA: diaminopimelate epimerase [Xanthomonadaceae bacterium]|jgi:diaminopimelate epimerase|nr:diaminopimelate epimerase [Xanthomonadaceae bacterium]
MVERLRFTKMHGAGNDFVMLDLRADASMPEAAALMSIADRRRGIGCDQVIGILDPATRGSVAAYIIWNADGSLAQQCGNGARCVAAWLRQNSGLRTDRFVLDSPAGPVAVHAQADDDFTLELSVPDFAPARIPLMMAAEQSMYLLDVCTVQVRFGAVSMGNPHALIEVADIATAPVHKLGTAMQAMREFPESVNVGFAQVLAPDRIALRVFERGVGETLACGSGACAAVAILVRQGRVDRNVAVELPGGTLRVAWPSDDAPVSMRGPAVFVFEGEWHP